MVILFCFDDMILIRLVGGIRLVMCLIMCIGLSVLVIISVMKFFVEILLMVCVGFGLVVFVLMNRMLNIWLDRCLCKVWICLGCVIFSVLIVIWFGCVVVRLCKSVWLLLVWIVFMIFYLFFRNLVVMV